MHATQSNTAAPQEYLTFRLGEEDYGIDILKVQEIRGYDHVTRIANAPAYIKGVIDLRGTIVPIIDMRIKFNLVDATYDQFTVVIVANIGERTIGLVVDGVSDVTALGAEQIRPAPALGAAVDMQYVTGLGSIGERMVILLDIERLLAAGELAVVHEAAEEALAA